MKIRASQRQKVLRILTCNTYRYITVGIVLFRMYLFMSVMSLFFSWTTLLWCILWKSLSFFRRTNVCFALLLKIRVNAVVVQHRYILHTCRSTFTLSISNVKWTQQLCGANKCTWSIRELLTVWNPDPVYWKKILRHVHSCLGQQHPQFYYTAEMHAIFLFILKCLLAIAIK